MSSATARSSGGGMPRHFRFSIIVSLKLFFGRPALRFPCQLIEEQLSGSFLLPTLATRQFQWIEISAAWPRWRLSDPGLLGHWLWPATLCLSYTGGHEGGITPSVWSGVPVEQWCENNALVHLQLCEQGDIVVVQHPAVVYQLNALLAIVNNFTGTKAARIFWKHDVLDGFFIAGFIHNLKIALNDS